MLIKKQWVKIKIIFKLILAILRSHERCLLAQLTSYKQNQSITAYYEQLSTINEKCDDEEKIEKDKNCLQQSAIFSYVNMDTEMVPAAGEVRTLNLEFYFLLWHCCTGGYSATLNLGLTKDSEAVERKSKAKNEKQEI